MRTSRSIVVLLTAAAASLSVAPATSLAATPVVTLQSDSANLNTFQFVDDAAKNQTDPTDDNFFRLARNDAPAKVTGTEGTASAFVSQASTMETPAQPPFPVAPLNDIAMSGTSTSGASATGNGPAVPVADSEGSLTASFGASQPVAVFFSGFMQTANSDAVDSCSEVTVDLTGPAGFARHFRAVTGACGASTPHSTGWAEKVTLPAGDYELDVDYSSEVDDTVPGEASSMSASATVTLDLGFLPPTARFTTTLAGSTAHFDAATSSVGISGRHLVKWLWTFGDGRTATTTTPRVTHVYTATPARAPTYAVGLQVLDSGGARSAKVTHNVLGTRTVETVSRTARTVNVSGAVVPNRHGHAVVVTLQRKSAGVFHTVVVHRPTLGPLSHFSTSFARRAAGSCRVVARYPGDATHLASQVTRSFAC